MSDLTEQLDKVSDRDSFLAFVRALIADRKRDPSTWENDTIEHYLESAIAWNEDTDQGVAREASWRAFATFLYCGKIYE